LSLLLPVSVFTYIPVHWEGGRKVVVSGSRGKVESVVEVWIVRQLVVCFGSADYLQPTVDDVLDLVVGVISGLLMMEVTREV
jgi:hypothetical protein